MTDPRANLPSVSALLDHPIVLRLVEDHGRDRTLTALRGVLEEARAGGEVPSTVSIIDAIAAQASQVLQRTRPLQGVINASGVILHTNLGRAVLSKSAVAAVTVAAGAVDVEYDLSGGGRHRRGAHVVQLLTSLCGAEAAFVVNNCSAALVLVMAALAKDREVVVSRGELVEIGGSFRLPDIITASGALLREVGTTNRTRLEDFARALDPATGAVLRVHPSNFRIEGFAEQPALEDVARVTRSRGIPLIHDIGSGLLAPSSLHQLRSEPDALSVLAQGADLVVFSGDKLLGGPQAGIIVGSGRLVEQCRNHPLARAFRVDKIRLAALEATLTEHALGHARSLPTWDQLVATSAALRSRAEALAEHVGGTCVVTTAMVGGGSAPGETIESCGVQLPGDAEVISSRLRSGYPPVISRIIDGCVVLDLRSVPVEFDAALGVAARDACTWRSPNGPPNAL